jgi:activator of HSP90 ATPase
MAKHIAQKVTFKNAKPKALYDLYMNAKQHSHIAGSPVKISAKAGTPFSAHNGYITGSTVHTVKDKLIVQNWRGANWNPADPDSVFTIVFEPKGKDTVLHYVHAGVPEAQAEGVKKGWNEHYWKPWKQHLAGKKITRPTM